MPSPMDSRTARWLQGIVTELRAFFEHTGRDVAVEVMHDEDGYFVRFDRPTNPSAPCTVRFDWGPFEADSQVDDPYTDSSLALVN